MDTQETMEWREPAKLNFGNYGNTGEPYEPDY